MGKKGGMPVYKTAEDYINHQKDEAKVILEELKSLVMKAVPDAKTLPDCKVPSFKLVEGTKNDLHIMIAAYAKFVSFYPFESTLEHFKEKLDGYELGKGTVKFPFNKSLPHDLIIEMTQFRKEEVTKDIG